MPKITALQSETSPTNDDFLAIVDNATGTTRKVTKADLLKGQALTNLNGGSTAGVLTTDTSGVVSVGTKTVDANGWTVYNYGGWKEYQKSYPVAPTLAVGYVGLTDVFPAGVTWGQAQSRLQSSITSAKTGGSEDMTFFVGSDGASGANSSSALNYTVHNPTATQYNVVLNVRILI